MIEKYNNNTNKEIDNINNNTTNNNINKLTIGKLSVFLSSCVMKEIECNSKEEESIQIVILYT